MAVEEMRSVVPMSTMNSHSATDQQALNKMAKALQPLTNAQVRERMGRPSQCRDGECRVQIPEQVWDGPCQTHRGEGDPTLD